MAKNDDITTRFKADIKDFKAGIEEAKKEITLANSKFKAASDGTKEWEKSTDGLSSKVTQLKSILDSQNKKLDAYKEELKVASKYEEEAKEEVEKLKKALSEAERVYGKNSKEVGKLKSELTQAEKEENKMSNQVHSLTVSMNNQQGTVNRTTAQLDRYTRELQETEKGESMLSKGMNYLGNVAMNVAANAISALTDKLKELVVESINVGKAFDYSMSEVQAISGATGKQYDELRKKAKQMGASTKFTATESSQAFKYMAMAGWDTNKMLKGIEGVMNLAAASGEDLATTSDIVTDSLTAFGMSANQCNRFVDVLAKASSSSNTNVSKMGETFKYVAPVAGQFGYKVEDVAVGIGLMANAGIKSATAGTSLRSILTRLATNAGATNKSIGALDIVTQKLGVEFYNADKTMRPFGDVLAELRPKWQKLNKEEQANFANKIAGKNALSGFNAMLNASDKDFEKLTKDINNSTGAAKKMANIMEDNLQGDLNKANSTLESLQLVLYEKVSPAFRTVTKAATNFGAELSKALQSSKPGSTLDFFNKSLDDAIKNFNMVSLINKLSDKIQVFFDNLFIDVDTQKAAVKFAAVLGKAMLTGFMLLTTSPIAILLDSVVVGALKSLIPKIGQFFVDIGNSISEFFSNIWNSIVEFFTSLPGKISEFFSNIWNSIVEFFTSLPGKISEFFSNIWNTITTFLSNLPGKIGYALGYVLGTISKFFIGIVRLAIVEVPKFILNVVKFFSQLPGKINVFILSAITRVALFVNNLKNKAIEAGSNFISNIVSFLKNLPSKIATFLTSTINKVKNFASNLKNKAVEAGNKFKDSLVSIVKSIPDKMEEIGKNIVYGIWNGINDAKDWLIGKVGEFKNGVIEGFEDAFKMHSPSKLMRDRIGKNIARGIAIGITKEIKTVLKTIKVLTNSYLTTAKISLKNSGFESYSKRLINVFNTNIDNYVKKSTTSFKNLINAKTEALKKATQSSNNKSTISNNLKNTKEATKKVITAYTNILKNFQSKAKKIVNDTLTNITKTYEEKYNKLVELHNTTYNKMLDYGSLTTNLNGIDVITSTQGLKEQTKYIKEYGNLLKKIKGKVGQNLYSAIANMDIKVGKSFAENLLKMNSKDLKEYNKAYEDQLKTAKSTSDSIYKSDFSKLNKQYNNAIDKALRNANTKLKNLGANSIKGFISGMKSQTSNLSKDIKSIANNIVKQFKKYLKIKSPSRVFADQVGKMIPLGISKGISDNVNSIYSDIKALSNGIVGYSNGLVSNLGNTGINNGYENNSNNVNITLNQTNNSPKALSRWDIYKDTKRQLSLMKEVMSSV